MLRLDSCYYYSAKYVERNNDIQRVKKLIEELAYKYLD